MAFAASQAGDADSSRAPGLTSNLQGSVNVHCGALLLVSQWQCISYFVFYIIIEYYVQSIKVLLDNNDVCYTRRGGGGVKISETDTAKYCQMYDQLSYL